MKTWGLAVALATALLLPNVANADDDDDRFATPPPDFPQRRGGAPIAASYAREPDETPVIAREPERPRSPARVEVGPAFVTTGKGVGAGLGGALDIGKGSVGGRLSAVWTRGEPGAGSLISESFSQYAAELVLDLNKRGPVHPILGVGFGLVRAEQAQTSGFGGVGLVRAGVEYALGFEETDVRLGATVTGGLLGPSDRELQDLRAHALFGAHVAIGL